MGCPVNTSTTELLHQRLRERCGKGRRNIRRTRGPRSLLWTVSYRHYRKATPINLNNRAAETRSEQ